MMTTPTDMRLLRDPWCLRSALFLCVASVALANQPIEPRVTLEVNEGYCVDGATLPLVPAKGDPAHLKVWGSLCNVNRPSPTKAKTSVFIAPPHLRVYMIGWATSPVLALERVSDGSRFLLVPQDQDDHRWSLCDYTLPTAWRGQRVRLVADEVGPHNLWRAFSEPLHSNSTVPMGDAATIFGLTTIHFISIIACGVALTMYAVLRGLVRDTMQAGLLSLAGTAVPGYCIFWFTLLAPQLSRYLAVAMLLGGLLGFILCLRKLNSEGRGLLRPLIMPLLLTGATAMLVLSSGFLYGGLDDPLHTARCRFLPRLPPDNEMPYLLASGARSPHMPIPLFGDWLSSDRPPLQSGMVLAQFPLLRQPRAQGYTVVGVLAQSLWIFSLWLLFSAFALERRVVALILAACLFTGFVFLNSFFVWPKLLAAAYTLGFLAAFVSNRVMPQCWLTAWAVPGTLLSFSLLSHGGAVFALVTAVPMVVVFRRPWPAKRMLASLAFAFVLYLPWMFYQKYYDPPGNRLLKLHLAGVETLDKRSFNQAFLRAYRDLTIGRIFDYKMQNFESAFGHGFQNLWELGILAKEVVTPVGGWQKAAAHSFILREQAFFYPAVSLGLFVLSPFALVVGVSRRRRSLEWQAACVLWIFTIASQMLWCLLMFGPHSTVIHQGSYATMLLAFAAGVLSLWSLSHWLAFVVTVLQIGINFLLDEALMRTPYSNGVLPQGLMHADTLVLLLFSLAAVGCILSWPLISEHFRLHTRFRHH